MAKAEELMQKVGVAESARSPMGTKLGTGRAQFHSDTTRNSAYVTFEQIV